MRGAPAGTSGNIPERKKGTPIQGLGLNELYQKKGKGEESVSENHGLKGSIDSGENGSGRIIVLSQKTKRRWNKTRRSFCPYTEKKRSIKVLLVSKRRIWKRLGESCKNKRLLSTILEKKGES